MNYLYVTLNGSTANILGAVFWQGVVILAINAGLLFVSVFCVWKAVANLFAARGCWWWKLMQLVFGLTIGLVVFSIFVVVFIATNTFGWWDFELRDVGYGPDRYEVRFDGATYRFGTAETYSAHFRLSDQEADLLSERLGRDVEKIPHGFSTGGVGAANPPGAPILEALVELFPEKFPHGLVEYYQQNDN